MERRWTNDTDRRHRPADTGGRKIISGTKVFKPTPLMKSLRKAVVGVEEDECKMDMFDIEEIKEIADYLMVYYEANQMKE